MRLLKSTDEPSLYCFITSAGLLLASNFMWVDFIHRPHYHLSSLLSLYYYRNNRDQIKSMVVKLLDIEELCLTMPRVSEALSLSFGKTSYTSMTSK
jgi:hypothetical protein